MFFPNIGEFSFYQSVVNTNKKLADENRNLTQRVAYLETAIERMLRGVPAQTSVEDFVLQQCVQSGCALNKLDHVELVKVLSVAVEKRLEAKS